MTLYKERKAAEAVHQNPPEDWREVWAPRQKIHCNATHTGALKHLQKKQDAYDWPLQIDIHPKDGYVVYYTKEESS